MPPKFRIQFDKRTAFIGGVSAVVLLLFIWILVCKCCSSEPEIQSVKTLVSALASVESGACIDVHGSVSGDILPGSRVNLYQVSSTEPLVVMKEIGTRKPIGWSTVDERKRFGFKCLSPGAYAFMIPVSSHNGSVGAPLPDEVECGSLSVEIAFQGGDGQYAVGSFSVNQSCGRA